MQWNKVITEIFGERTKLVFPRFFMSKKNQVTLLIMEKDGKELNIISKFFVWGNAETEWNILTKAYQAGLDVPKPIRIYNNIIFMEYIPGTTLMMLHDKHEEKLPVELLAEWLAKFHKTFSNGDKTLLKGDGMFPNFIFQKESHRLFGVDFEESVEGREIVDVADMMTSLLMSGDSFSAESRKETGKFLYIYLKNHPVEFDREELLHLLLGDMEKRILYVPQMKKKIEGYMEIVKSTGTEFVEKLITETASLSSG